MSHSTVFVPSEIAVFYVSCRQSHKLDTLCNTGLWMSQGIGTFVSLIWHYFSIFEGKLDGAKKVLTHWSTSQTALEQRAITGGKTPPALHVGQPRLSVEASMQSAHT